MPAQRWSLRAFAQSIDSPNFMSIRGPDKLREQRGKYGSCNVLDGDSIVED
jgi:hypothetical protein